MIDSALVTVGGDDAGSSGSDLSTSPRSSSDHSSPEMSTINQYDAISSPVSLGGLGRGAGADTLACERDLSHMESATWRTWVVLTGD